MPAQSGRAVGVRRGELVRVVSDPVNLFQDSGPRPDGTLAVGVAASSPRDAIAFLAHRDLVVIVTACSVDYPPLNQGHCSPLRIEISPVRARDAPDRRFVRVNC